MSSSHQRLSYEALSDLAKSLNDQPRGNTIGAQIDWDVGSTNSSTVASTVLVTPEQMARELYQFSPRRSPRLIAQRIARASLASSTTITKVTPLCYKRRKSSLSRKGRKSS